MGKVRKAGSQQDKSGATDPQRDLAALLSGLMGGQTVQSGSLPGSEGTGLASTGESNEVSDILGGLLGSSASQTGSGQSGSGQSGGGQSDGGLLNAPSGGTFQQNPASVGTDSDDLTNMLGSLLGGGMAQANESQQSSGSGDMMGSLLGSLLGGGMAQSNAPQQSSGGGDLMGSLLGSLLGGGMTGTSGPQQSSGSGDMMGSLLGSLLGGGGSSGGSPLGSLIGSSQASDNVSQQTGIAPALVQALLPMLVGLLFRGDKRSSARGGVDIDGDGIPDNSDQLLALMQTVQQGGDVDISDVRSSGYARALANQSGYPVDEVAPATVKILEYLAQQQ